MVNFQPEFWSVFKRKKQLYPFNTGFADSLDLLGIDYVFESFNGTHASEALNRVPIALMFLDSVMNSTRTNIEPGDVSGTWTKANSPYHINGEITIPNDSTLTIEPGVEVVFTGNYKFNVQGRLLAIGTETDRILFTINDTTGFHDLTIPDGGWGGIRFIDTPPNNDSSKIIYSKLQYGKANTGAGYYDRWGGALCAKTNKLLVSHCLFRNNTCYHNIYTETGGGAVAIIGNPIVEFCEFTENASTFGAAMMIWGSNLYPLIRNNYFHHNEGHGTINIGSWSGNNTSPVLINNIISYNISNGLTAPSGHGIVHFSNGGGTPVLINNTIVNNSCTVSGGGIFVNTGPTPLLINNIIYGNTPSQVDLLTLSNLSFYNCLLEGGKEGFTGAAFTGAYENCIDADPQFASSNDYHLQDNSPCIGAAIDSTLIGSQWHYCPSIDYEGNPRPNPSGSMPDIGAYENELRNPAVIPEWVNYNTSNSGLPSNKVTCIEIDESGNKWIGTEAEFNHSTLSYYGGGLAKFDGTEWTIFDKSNSGLPSNSVSCIEIDKSGNKWIGTYGGLAKFDGINWTIYNISNSGLPSNIINCIEIDKFDIKWIGTEEGLVKFDGTYWNVYNTSNSGLPKNWVNAIAINGNGNKWIGVYDDFVKFYDTNWTVYNTQSPTGYLGVIECIKIDNAGNKWIGVRRSEPMGWHGLISYDEQTFTYYTESADSVSWLCSITCIVIDEFDNKWIGGYWPYGGGLGLAKFDGTNWTVYSTSNSGLPDYRVNAIAIDGNGNKWIGTNGGGLVVYNEGGVVSVEEKPDLPNRIPTKFVLYQNYPNPFNPSTTIKYSIPSSSVILGSLPASSVGANNLQYFSSYSSKTAAPQTCLMEVMNDISRVNLKVYDILGREVATLVNENQKAGNYEVEWNASKLPSGVYFYQLSVGNYIETKKMVLLR